jgi:lipopolysaccharide transport system ATP-binding protein
VTDSSGRQVLHFNSVSHGISLHSEGPTLRVMDFQFPNTLCPGEYGLIAGIGTFTRNPKNNGQFLTDEIVDYCVGGARFTVQFPETHCDEDLWGLVHIPCSVSEYMVS